MICAIFCNCENGHNIAGAAYESKNGRPDEAEAEEACQSFEKTMRAHMAAGNLPPVCPMCGSVYNGQWELTLHSTKMVTVDELNNDLAERSMAGRLKAQAALRARRTTLTVN